MSIIDEDPFGKTPLGQLALRKLAPVAEGFVLYRGAWLGKKNEVWTHMRYTGCQFRAAKSGPRAGQLVIPIPGTTRSVVVSRSELAAT